MSSASTISNIIDKAKAHIEELQSSLTKEYGDKIATVSKKEFVFTGSAQSDSVEWAEQVAEAEFKRKKEAEIASIKDDWKAKKEMAIEAVDWNEYFKGELGVDLSIVNTSTGPVIFNNKIFHYYPGNSFDTFLFMRCGEDTEIALPRYLLDGTTYQNLNSLFMDGVLPAGVRFASEDMRNVKNIDNMLNGVKYKTLPNLSCWHSLNVKAVDDQTNKIITGVYDDVNEDDIKLSPETKKWMDNGSYGEPPESYYTDALTAFRDGAKRLIESYEKETGEKYEQWESNIDFNIGLNKLFNMFPDFKIESNDLGSVIYSEKLYRYKHNCKLDEPSYFKEAWDVDKWPIKPVILETGEEYPYICDADGEPICSEPSTSKSTEQEVNDSNISEMEKVDSSVDAKSEEPLQSIPSNNISEMQEVDSSENAPKKEFKLTRRTHTVSSSSISEMARVNHSMDTNPKEPSQPTEINKISQMAKIDIRENTEPKKSSFNKHPASMNHVMEMKKL